jgi:two-component system, cell cycle response regulator DivK
LQGSTLAQRHAPDIVLVDVQRPCIDGCESLRHLRQQSTLGCCPIIAMATLETRSDRDRLLRAGFSGCIPKPIRFHELSKQVAEHFHRTGIPGSCGESRPTPPKS